MKLFVVIGGWMDYGDRNDVLIGVFDDEARAADVSRDVMSTDRYDVTRVVPMGLNEICKPEGWSYGDHSTHTAACPVDGCEQCEEEENRHGV